MKHFLLSLIFLMTLVACSSQKKVKTIVKEYDPVVEQEAQVAKVNTMIQNDPELDQKKKDELIKLVNEQSNKMMELKKEQSQLRQALIDQLLLSKDGSSSEVTAVKKQLNAINKKSMKGLNDFIMKFMSISGERAHRQDDFMREVGSIHFL